MAWGVILVIMGLVLAPHFGLTLLSLDTIWSFSVLPDAFTLKHFVAIFAETPEYMTNTVLYSVLAAVIDVILATAIAYVVLRTKLIGRQWLDYIAMAAVAIPGLVIGIGYLRTFFGFQVPGLESQSFATWWVAIVIALAVRRLPYALRACMAALQQVSVSLEESAESLGAGKLTTVRKNVAFGLEERRVPRSEINQRVDLALDLVGLLDFAKWRPSQLSGGQQQRVALARTIVIEPQVLLLDEPLSNLDAKLRVQMRRELRQLQRKLSLTTIFVTHDQEAANTTADRIAVINDGIVQQIGTPMELYDRPANLFVANFLGVANVVAGRMADEDGRLVFRSDDAAVVVPVAQGSRGDGNIIFRPQNLNILPPGVNPGPRMTRLDGRVEHKEFLGSVVRYRVAVGGHFILVDAPHQRDHPAMPEGTQVTLCLNSDQVIGLPNQ